MYICVYARWVIPIILCKDLLYGDAIMDGDDDLTVCNGDDVDGDGNDHNEREAGN